MKKIKRSIVLLRENFGAIVIFESLLKLFSILLLTPLLTRSFKMVLRSEGFVYLSTDNMMAFFTRPIPLLYTLVVLFVCGMLLMIELSGLIYSFDASQQGVKISAYQMFYQGIRSALRIFRPKNWFLLVFLLVMLPIAQVSSAPSSLLSIKVPVFILRYIESQPILAWVQILLVLVLCLYALNWMYSLHYYTLDDSNFKTARRQSKQLIKKRSIPNLLSFLGWEFLIVVVFAFLLALMILALVAGVVRFFEYHILVVLLVSIFVALLTFLQYCVLIPLGISYISVLFYQEKEKKGESICPVVAVPAKNPPDPKRRRRVMLLLFVLAVAANAFYLSNTMEKFADGQKLRPVLVTAHRGDSLNAPENTLPAFDKAIEAGADVIELDVAQLRDGTVVVMHDSNFKRIGGLNRSVWQVNYSQVKDMDVGSWFSSKFKDVRISTLEEVVQHCKGKIKLNIELKPTGREQNLEEEVVGVLQRNQVVDQCEISSLNYQSLERVKELDPQIQTVYVLAIAVGNLETLEAADAFSVEMTSITPSLVREIHGLGKEVLVWTPNFAEEMEEMLEMDVDNLITDEPRLARELLEHRTAESDPLSAYSIYLNRMFQTLLGENSFSINLRV